MWVMDSLANGQRVGERDEVYGLRGQGFGPRHGPRLRKAASCAERLLTTPLAPYVTDLEAELMQRSRGVGALAAERANRTTSCPGNGGLPFPAPPMEALHGGNGARAPTQASTDKQTTSTELRNAAFQVPIWPICLAAPRVSYICVAVERPRYIVVEVPHVEGGRTGQDEDTPTIAIRALPVDDDDHAQRRTGGQTQEDGGTTRKPKKGKGIGSLKSMGTS